MSLLKFLLNSMKKKKNFTRKVSQKKIKWFFYEIDFSIFIFPWKQWFPTILVDARNLQFFPGTLILNEFKNHRGEIRVSWRYFNYSLFQENPDSHSTMRVRIILGHTVYIQCITKYVVTDLKYILISKPTDRINSWLRFRYGICWRWARPIPYAPPSWKTKTMR